MYTDIYIYVGGGNIISCIHIYHTRIFIYKSLINHFIIALFFFGGGGWGGTCTSRRPAILVPAEQDAGASSFQRSYHLRCSYSSSRLQAPSEKTSERKPVVQLKGLMGTGEFVSLTVAG